MSSRHMMRRFRSRALRLAVATRSVGLDRGEPGHIATMKHLPRLLPTITATRPSSWCVLRPAYHDNTHTQIVLVTSSNQFHGHTLCVDL